MLCVSQDFDVLKCEVDGAIFGGLKNHPKCIFINGKLMFFWKFQMVCLVDFKKQTVLRLR